MALTQDMVDTVIQELLQLVCLSLHSTRTREYQYFSARFIYYLTLGLWSIKIFPGKRVHWKIREFSPNVNTGKEIKFLRKLVEFPQKTLWPNDIIKVGKSKIHFIHQYS